MNFKYMPELEWRWGYAFVWGVMLAMVAGLIGYFKKKHWL
jgi:magnesium transporter